MFLLNVNNVFNIVQNGVPFVLADAIKTVCALWSDPPSFTATEISQDLIPLSSWADELRVTFIAEKLRRLLKDYLIHREA